MEWLAESEGVSVSEYAPEFQLEPKGKQVHFRFTRFIGEGGDEQFEGSYRDDGTLEQVIQKMEYTSHSMGPRNMENVGHLTRRYSKAGKLEEVNGHLTRKLLSSGKIEEEYVITKLDDNTEYFITDIPPLKLPKRFLKRSDSRMDKLIVYDFSNGYEGMKLGTITFDSSNRGTLVTEGSGPAVDRLKVDWKEISSKPQLTWKRHETAEEGSRGALIGENLAPGDENYIYAVYDTMSRKYSYKLELSR